MTFMIGDVLLLLHWMLAELRGGIRCFMTFLGERAP